MRRRALLALGACVLMGGTGAGAAGRRLVVVGGALTEMVYALGAESELVGVDTTSVHPPAARALPSVGYARALSAEGVLSLDPTHVVATEDAGPPAVMRQLAAAGVPVTVLSSEHRFEGMLDRLRRLGALLGREAPAAALARRLDADWSAATARVRARTGAAPRVLFVLSHTPAQLMVAGRDTAADAMIGYAGALNALQGVQGYKPLTPEAAIAAAPDVVLATEQGLAAVGGADRLLAHPGLAQTPAARARRVVALEANLLLGFGPRLPEALAQLDRALAARP